jgi:adenosylcobinamide-GDP ribazoletransferase
MRRQLHIFLTAVMFYTRIPCPSWVDHDAELLNKATMYFPLIGYIVAGFSALVLYISSLVLPLSVAVILSMVATILLTGAFHEDGFADVCDAFGGGWTKEKILEIMKDSRLGTYGVIGLILILGLKYTAISSFEGRWLFTSMILAHPLSRFIAVMIIASMNYVRENEDAKAKPVAKVLSNVEFAVAGLFAVAPFVILILSHPNVWLISLVVIPLASVLLYLRGYFSKWIGGYTGDCLGATQQISEVVIYLSLIAIIPYIK